MCQANFPLSKERTSGFVEYKDTIGSYIHSLCMDKQPEKRQALFSSCVTKKYPVCRHKSTVPREFS